MTNTSETRTPSFQTSLTRRFVTVSSFMVLACVLESVLLVKGLSGEVMTLFDTLVPVIIVGAVAVVPTALVLFQKLLRYHSTEIVGPVTYAIAFVASFFLCSSLGIISMNFFYLFHLLLPSAFLYYLLRGYKINSTKHGDPVT